MDERVLPRSAVLGAAAIAVAVTTIGFLLDAQAFALHLLAETVGLIMGGLLGVLVIDQFAERARQARWQLVADGTMQSLRSAVMRAAIPLFLELPAPRPPAADPVAMEAAGELPNALTRIAAELTRLGPFERTSKPSELLAELAPHVRIIREVVLPRLLLIGADPALIRPIVDLERSFELLEYHVSIEQMFGLPPHALRENLVSILKNFRGIAVAIGARD